MRENIHFDDGEPSVVGSEIGVEEFNYGPDKAFAKGEITASAREILHTYIAQGNDCRITIPKALLHKIKNQIEEYGYDTPEIFNGAKDHVFQVMEREAFPGFLNLGKPVFRMFRKSKSLGGLVNKIALRGHYLRY